MSWRSSAPAGAIPPRGPSERMAAGRGAPSGCTMNVAGREKSRCTFPPRNFSSLARISGSLATSHSLTETSCSGFESGGSLRKSKVHPAKIRWLLVGGESASVYWPILHCSIRTPLAWSCTVLGSLLTIPRIEEELSKAGCDCRIGPHALHTRRGRDVLDESRACGSHLRMLIVAVCKKTRALRGP